VVCLDGSCRVPVVAQATEPGEKRFSNRPLRMSTVPSWVPIRMNVGGRELSAAAKLGMGGRELVGVWNACTSALGTCIPPRVMW